MPIVAGIDEAGYGPLLGPLVVALSAFRVSGLPEHGGDGAFELWSRLEDAAVLRAPPAARRGERKSGGAELRDERLIVCDSKKVYAHGKGLRRMEETVLAFAGSAARAAGAPEGADRAGESGPFAATLRGFLGAHGHDPAALEAYPWYRGRDLSLPHLTFKTVVQRQMAGLRRGLAGAGIEALALTPRVVHPLEFNEGVRREGNKHRFEWEIVARFLRELWERHADEGVAVLCDKLGGRDFYGAEMGRLFPEARVTASIESGGRSEYRISRGASRMTVAFVVEGDDSSFPTALASCCAKYVRELFMSLLNAYFIERLPGLRETAGYSTDGRRFADEVRDEMRRLEVDEALLVRCC